ncbi:LysR family transcriptional regulator [Microvirga tunisiensis]|uniref:LysR family transcriptional regulator n=1 Tax=Pannonibacter tanglangensis TaxID=2750084 RepID=A0A7X5J9M1_9HYPH|nr:LysR substrate-binding domain-containing protein [Pannonibacter sp. XCT-53]NBN79964.1 LysR family transcriptional regulator [Pannonibacter sp. XCT-53]
MSDLPPLAALRVFDAAARLGNFTRAAEELGMTQAAVSYQIRLLEERSGGPLFRRAARHVELTDLGRQLAPAVHEAFDLIRDAFAGVRAQAEGALTISCVATFATQWLARHLGAFQLLQPRLAVRVETSGQLVDFARDTVDISIRSGKGQWPGLTAHLLLPARFTPMLHPDLAASIGGVREPADLLKLKIIDPSDPWWPQWFAMAGVTCTDLDSRTQTRLGAQILEANAAAAGQGVAILTPWFYRDEIERGRLYQPFALTCDDGSGYWLCYPPARRNSPKIRAFRQWILAALQTEPGTDAPAVSPGSPAPPAGGRTS